MRRPPLLGPTAAASLTAALFCPLAPSQSDPAPDAAVPPRVRSLTTSPASDRVFLDAPGDGSIWARGHNWKAQFTGHGATFVPCFGSDSPRNFPITFSLEQVRAGTTTLALDLAGDPVAGPGNAVTLPRGALAEVYLLQPGQMEQTFVFPARQGHGDLSVRLRVQTELSAEPDPLGGFRFGNAFGQVRYGTALAYDARGQRTPVASTLRDGVLELTVPAAFHDRAAFPLTIDPLILTFSVSGAVSSLPCIGPDAAVLGTFTGVQAVVFEEVYSATDHDIYVRYFDLAGTPVGGQYIDATTQNWIAPRIASHRGASQFLVVATRGPGNGSTTIWGRQVNYSGAAFVMGSQFGLHGFGSGKNPDVGGDPNPSPPLPGNFCVTWEGQNNGEIYFNIVRTNGTLLWANGAWLDPGTEFCSRPRIGKSCGMGALNTRQWVIVWQKRYSPTDEDIFGTLIGHSGTVDVLEFQIDYSGFNDTNPAVSSKADLIDGHERFLVAWQRDIPGGPFNPPQSDVMGSLWSGTTPLSGTINLTSLLQASTFANQTNPCVDTDGCRFAVGYSQWSALTSQDVVPYLATVHALPGGGLGYTELPVMVNAYAGPDDHMRISSHRNGGSFTDRYVAAWDTASITNSQIYVNAALYDGHVGLGPTSYFNHALPGCGSLTLNASGLPAQAQTFSLTLTGAQGLPFLMIGPYLATPLQICPACTLGVDQTAATVLYTTSYTVTVPCNSMLIAYQFACQGIDIFAPGGCSAPIAYTLSNEILVTLL